MDGGFLFSYSDIVFAPEHARRVAAATAPVALVVDRRWRDAYEGRTLHPVSEAELARVDGTGDGATVTRVGKRLVAEDEAAGEFIGLARFSPEGAAALRAVWREALARGLDAPFGAAATLRQAYLTDGLNARRGARRGAAARCSSTAAGARSTPSRTWRAPSWSSTPGGRDMPGSDPGHWLHRLDAGEWLAAAATELAHARGEARRAAPSAPASRTRGAPPAWPGTPCW